MKEKEWQNLLAAYLDGELREEDIPRLATALRADPRAADDLMRFERIESLVAQLPTPTAPSDLAQRVMDRIPFHRAPQRPLWRRVGISLTGSPWRLLGAGGFLAAAGVAIGLLLGGGSGLPSNPSGAPSESVVVHFVFESDDARSISVAGSFNDWDATRTPMKRTGNTWRVSVAVEPGRHEYLFVVNEEEWVPDPSASEVADDGFGARNSVLNI